jgi:CO/xanthine dehydrogenase Mo-binding subunit
MPRPRQSVRAPKSASANGSVGTSIPKLEAHDKVTGTALYLDDLRVPGTLHGRTVRSTIPRGRIRKVTLDPAFDWTGVTVVDHKDIPGENVVALIEDDQPILAVNEIRHAEEPILLLAHESAEHVEKALRAVRIEVEPLEPVLTVEQALARKHLLYKDTNVFKEIRIDRGDVRAAIHSAGVAGTLLVEGVYRTGHQEQLYIENNAMMAERTEDGTLLVRGSLQCPYYVHKALMRAFALPAGKVRVVQTVTGGGFGGKEEYPSLIGAHAALLAWKSGKPVKIVYDRLEDIAATTKRHPSEVRIVSLVDRDGSLLALDIDVVMDGGAYVTLSPVVLSRGAIHASGPYRCANTSIRARAVATNTPPNGAFRGFGAPQTEFAMECHMDRIASQLRMDPLEVRRRNAVREGDITPTGQVLTESVGAHEVLERTVRRSHYEAKRKKYATENAAAARAERAGKFDGRARRVRRGIGLALVYHGAGFTGGGEVKLASLAAVDVTPRGRPRILSASTEIGQGTNTIFAQMVGDALGVPAEFVEIETPDTGVVPDSGPTVASRTCMVVGGMLVDAARQMKDELAAFAGNGWTDGAGFEKAARRYLTERGPLRAEKRYLRPPELSWDDDTYKGDAYGVFSYAACTVEVEVDLDTGETTLLHVATAHDIGKAIHPVLAAGQIEGGVVQGLGWALLEDVRWKDGRVWNHQLTNYIIPTAMDIPALDVEIVEIPYSRGPFGAKGVGELPMDVPAPAVVSAIAQATGIRIDEIPVLPEKILRALRAAASAAA